MWLAKRCTHALKTSAGQHILNRIGSRTLWHNTGKLLETSTRGMRIFPSEPIKLLADSHP